LDGVFGGMTDAAVRDYQHAMALTVDGIAGIATQRSLAIREAANVTRHFQLPQGALKGQIEAESAFILGNHSPQYNGFYDTGIAQRSSQYTPFIEGFHVIKSLDALGSRLRMNYNRYKSFGKITNERRLWELAQGSWNAPSWTDTLAKGGTLSPANRQWIEDYIDRVTVYLVV
jgi:peptidoglycan hydrolase-like protein with peptidoglycan-binding domain